MPRQPRIDIPGLLYHVIARGIERRSIFLDSSDSKKFLHYLSIGIPKYKIQCFAWALMPNHIHLLLRAGPLGIAPLMRSVLTGYAVYFNQKHQRAGHLFQNRYKSLICEEESYFLELVRYIHLNPVRARIVKTLEELDEYPWTGHAVLAGRSKINWQDTSSVLIEFGEHRTQAMAAYRDFIWSAAQQGERPDLLKGGFKSAEQADISMENSISGEKSKEIFDSRVLGDSEFTTQVLTEAEQLDETQQRLKRQKWTLEQLTHLVSQKFEVPYDLLVCKGRQENISRAKAILIHLGTDYSGDNLQTLAEWTKMSLPAASKARQRGRWLNQEKLIDFSSLPPPIDVPVYLKGSIPSKLVN